MFNISDGAQLASVDLPAYLSSGLADDDLSSSPPLSVCSSFCLLQVSADLSTAVAVTQSNTAVAIDLNHYFRYSMSLFLYLLLVFSLLFCFIMKRDSWSSQYQEQHSNTQMLLKYKLSVTVEGFFFCDM